MQIGDWVLHAACAQAAAWRRDGLEIPISVNISARELFGSDLAERVQEALLYHRLPGGALCLDVSEEVVLRDPARARAALNEVRRLGVAVALDNFGARRSTLSLPGSLPLTMLKLDRTLVQGFERDKDRRAMVVAALALARESGLTAVAVGIETARQLALARELELLGRPGLSPAPTRSARAAAPQRAARGGKVGATMAPDRATARHHPPLGGAGPSEDRYGAAHAPARDAGASDGATGGAAAEGGPAAPGPTERFKRAAAEAAAAIVQDGMRVGLGTGSTVAHLLPALAARGLRDLRCAATSPATERAARALGLVVEDLDALGELDLAIDGADQVDPAGWLVKGGGAAQTREKIVAAAAHRFVVIVSAEKAVATLRPPVPLEVLHFGAGRTLAEVGEARLRGGLESPDGNLIADYFGPVDDPAALAARLSATPGVVEHGLFAPEMVSCVLIAGAGGVERRAGVKRDAGTASSGPG